MSPAAPAAAPAAPAAPPVAAPSSPAVANPAPPNGELSPAGTSPPGTASPPPSPIPSIGTAELPQDLSPWGMFLHADIIVKVVMIGLAIASLVTWTVWVAKTLELAGARRQVRRGLRTLANCATLAQAYEQLRDGKSTVGQLMQAAANEIRLSANLRGDGLKERIAWQLERIEMAASRRISRGTGVLATIGATAPFIGLFGTVWGIMTSFAGIAEAKDTSLAVVAPGIAEALAATAIGLAAAIPASVGYNRIGAALARAGQELSHLAEERAVGMIALERPLRKTAEAA